MSTAAGPSLARSFAKGLVATLVVLGGLGGLVLAFGTGRDRPSGVAATWLTAVSDTTRAGVQADAKSRALATGSPAALAQARSLLPPHPGAKAAFAGYEVGRAVVSGRTAKVPFLLHQQGVASPGGTRRGSVRLAMVGGRWRVVGLGSSPVGPRPPLGRRSRAGASSPGGVARRRRRGGAGGPGVDGPGPMGRPSPVLPEMTLRSACQLAGRAN